MLLCNEGFGPLTQQTICSLLQGFHPPPPTTNHNREIRFLDVATGPGFVLSAAVNEAISSDDEQQQFHLTGLDITKNFLTLAEHRIKAQLKKAQNPKQIKVDFVEGSAESLPFDDNTVDRICCNFGILHFFKPNLFLAESYRILRPGGIISFSCWSPPSRTEGFCIALEAIAEGGNPNIVGLPDGPNFFEFGDKEQAITKLNEIGFENVSSAEVGDMKWINIKNGRMLYDTLLKGTSRTREILLGQTAKETAAIQSLMMKKYDTMTDGGTRPLNMPAFVTSGQKPNQ